MLEVAETSIRRVIAGELDCGVTVIIVSGDENEKVHETWGVSERLVSVDLVNKSVMANRDETNIEVGGGSPPPGSSSPHHL